MAGQLDSLFKNAGKSVVSQLGVSQDYSITYTKKASPSYNTSTGALTTTDTSYSIKVPISFIRSEEETGQEMRQAKLYITPDQIGDNQVDGVELACTTIPNGIKYAQYELARALANDTDAMTGNTGTDGNIEEVKLGDIQVKYNTSSQGTGSINNILDVYPWLQSYLGAYMLGGAGSFQLRVVRG